MTEEMTSRQRILATVAGKPVDRFPVWLKMTNDTWRTAQPESVRQLDDIELLQAAGCDLLIHNGIGARVERPDVEKTVEQRPGLRITRYQTPDGTLTAEQRLDPGTNSWHPTKFPATTPEELKALRWCFDRTTWRIDPDQVQAARDRQKTLEARDAFTIGGVGPGPLMDLVEHQCGPEHTAFLLYDEPELFAEILQVMHADRMRWYDAVLPHWQADTFWMTENTSTTLISPEMFRRFSVPHLIQAGRRIEQEGIISVHHMCGTLNALLEDIDALPARVNEAYTTRPLGDVSLAEGRTRMRSKCLLGGTNATLWMAKPEAIVAEVAADLEACPDRRKIFLTSAGVLPAGVDLAKARSVVEGFKRLAVE